MSKKPEAIKLANILQYKLPRIECFERSAAELRRLHVEVERLWDELERLTTLRPHNEHKQGDRVLIWEKVLLHEDRWLFWNHGDRCPPGAYWTPLPDVKEPK
jgi:hypothetical protein